MYDWALTFGQEVELVWRQRWSLMTVLYLSVRYLGILYAIIEILLWVPTISATDVVSFIMYVIQEWTTVVGSAILGVIMITRLYAMYHRSRQVLILLVVVCLAVNIADVVVVALSMRHSSGDELILSGTYQCTVDFSGEDALLVTMTWIFTTVWEVLALCFAVWIAIKHFRELRRQTAGGIIGDCFTVLMKTHVVYFASFVAGSCLNLGYTFSTMSADSYSIGTQIYLGVLQIFMLIQMFVLGPRLILSIREYNAKLVADSDAGTAMTSIAFQMRVHVSTSSSV
ncbi:uncharacterized protein EDB91DRAFT_1346052 [Suillus paluster]|uniref:uncharacterized protein n=1 Tax=Suillus paluster TaxID=48578 RepID=UPI001B87AFFD|nr:uncharacterized protein EDB91DRAFT_1346052 [Suillus paluster]KAG1743953.1 hypothetical protein EDB91DRAFT_1346052 [Suillus paluster]